MSFQVNQREWETMMNALKNCSYHLSAINKRVTKYLDRVEDGWTRSLRYVPRFSVSDPAVEEWANLNGAPSSPLCSWCLADIPHPDYYIRCQHATLCGACAPCDECSS